MSFFFDCPFCGKEMKCADECDGEIINCPHCNEEVVAENCIKPVKNDGIYRSTTKINATDRTTSPKSRTIYVLLAIFFGSLGIHNFYAGFIAEAFLQLLLGFAAIGMNSLAYAAIFDSPSASYDFSMMAFVLFFFSEVWAFANLFRNVDPKNLKMKW